MFLRRPFKGRQHPGAQEAYGCAAYVESGDNQVTLQITDYAQPCRNIARYFQLRRYGRISQKRNPGMSRLYAKVLSPGRVKVGDALKVLKAQED